MLIQTHESWELDFPKLYDPPGTRIYPFIQLSINCYLFHVDVITYSSPENEPMPQIRFIATDILQALVLIDDEHVEKFSISIQSRRCDNSDDEYRISTITEVLKAKDYAGQISYIYICKDRKRLIDSPLASSEKELTNARSKYNHGEKPSSKMNT